MRNETMYSMINPKHINAIVYIPESKVREKLDKGYDFYKKAQPKSSLKNK